MGHNATVVLFVSVSYLTASSARRHAVDAGINGAHVMAGCEVPVMERPNETGKEKIAYDGETRWIGEDRE